LQTCQRAAVDCAQQADRRIVQAELGLPDRQGDPDKIGISVMQDMRATGDAQRAPFVSLYPSLVGWPDGLDCSTDYHCRFRILDSSVPMVQPAKDRMRNNVSEPLDWARAGSVLPERNVSSPFVIIGRIFCKNSSKVLCVEHNQMIRALASDRPDQAFNISILPGRAE
jgi:hypothetical protein